MPKETFLNLSIDKKNNVENALINEFSNNLYQNAKVSNIIKYASIPRGSFYRYFIDIKDAYFHIIDKLFSDVHFNPSIYDELSKVDDFSSDNIANIIEEKILSKCHDESLHKLKINFMREVDKDIIEKKQEVKNIFYKKRRQFIIKLQEKNLIRQDVDIDVLSIILNAISDSFENFISLDKEVLIKLIKSTINIIINGIGEQNG